MTEQLRIQARDIVADLNDQTVWQFAPGERLWKLFIIRPSSGQATRLEHRIYTKQKADGHLAMITFAVHAPAPGKQVRSRIARVPDLPPDALELIIQAIRRETQTQAHEYREIDLANQGDLADQMTYLREQLDVSDPR